MSFKPRQILGDDRVGVFFQELVNFLAHGQVISIVEEIVRHVVLSAEVLDQNVSNVVSFCGLLFLVHLLEHATPVGSAQFQVILGVHYKLVFKIDKFGRKSIKEAPTVGLEPTTTRLRVWRSTD